MTVMHNINTFIQKDDKKNNMSTDRGKGRETPLFGVIGSATASANVSVAADSWLLAHITRYTCKLVPGTCTRVM
jgi:hypothetical protein